MTRSEAVRLVALIAQCEIALVRRDPVAAPLLAQAVRAAQGLSSYEHLAVAAEIARRHDPGEQTPESRARHKAVQALVRLAAQGAQEAALS